VIAARWPIAGSAHSPDVEAFRHVAVMRCMTCVAGHHQHVIGAPQRTQLAEHSKTMTTVVE
jgi:hypothetical protein